MHHSSGRPAVSHYARGLLTATAVFASIAQAVIPTPTVTGPIPSDTPGSPGHNYTYWATDIVLKNFGYTEEEFFFEGTANRYDAAAPSGAVGNANRCSPIANIVTANIPYKSRMRVIRPTDPAKFNGTVVVEWTNVTNGYDTPVWWLKPKAFYLREGYAHVEVSAQNAGLNNSPNGLRNWSPTRYGSLDVIGGGTQTGDVLSYDIFSQAAAAIRNVPVVLGGLRAQVLIGVGESQSAGRLGVYANAIHSRDPVYNGIIMSEGGEVICNNAATTPVMKVLSETEFAGQTNEISALQPDTDKFRMWPVAGMSHSDQYSLLSRAALLQRDIGQLAQDTCATPARSRVETRYIYASSVDAMNKWIRVRHAAADCGPLRADESARCRSCTRRLRQRDRRDPHGGNRCPGREGSCRHLRPGRHPRALHDRGADQPLFLPSGLREQGDAGGARLGRQGVRVTCGCSGRNRSSAGFHLGHGPRMRSVVRGRAPVPAESFVDPVAQPDGVPADQGRRVQALADSRCRHARHRAGIYPRDRHRGEQGKIRAGGDPVARVYRECAADAAFRQHQA